MGKKKRKEKEKKKEKKKEENMSWKYKLENTSDRWWKGPTHLTHLANLTSCKHVSNPNLRVNHLLTSFPESTATQQ